MSWDAERASVRFEPLRPASRKRLIVGIVLGPLLWLVALVIAAWVLNITSAIEIGFAVAAASFLVAALTLAVLRRGRIREERRYVDRG